MIINEYSIWQLKTYKIQTDEKHFSLHKIVPFWNNKFFKKKKQTIDKITPKEVQYRTKWRVVELIQIYIKIKCRHWNLINLKNVIRIWIVW